jgi:hypothetical protein
VVGTNERSFKLKKDILVIGDAHSNPAFNNDRFDWLGQLIVDTRPDVIVDVGDFADMASLSSYDIGKKCFEGRTYKGDIECAIDARKRVKAPSDALSAQLKAGKKKQWNPRWVSCGGNHEEARINRAIDSDSKLDGLISHWDLGYKELGWEYHPFGEMVDIEGIAFTHFFMAGVMGRSIGGLYPTVSILKKFHMSCVQGHTHYFQMRHELGRHGKIYAFIAGCYFDYDPTWTNASIFYDRGILILRGVEDGNIESFEWLGINEIKARYAK